MFDKYEDEGLMIITLVGENSSRETPDLEDLQQWADTFGANYPVVADAEFEVSSRFALGGTLSLPGMTLIAPGGEILVADGWVEEDDIIAHLPGARG